MMVMSILFKASLILLAAAGLEHALGRRISAAARHMIWTLAIVASLMLPVLSLLLPQWTAMTWTSPAASIASVPPGSSMAAIGSRANLESDAAASLEPTAPVRSRVLPVSWASVLLSVYAAGVALLLLRMVLERLMLQRLVHGAVRIADRAWLALLDECTAALGVRRRVRLLRSSETMMPMAFGIWRSSVLLPAGADDWSDDRRRAVLLHELAHVARFDCLTQTTAALASAVYWPHPVIWWAARRLRIERELACDDCVLASGADARDYAGHLLDLAHSLGGRRAPALAVAMAGSRQLEGRLLAALDAARHRAAPALRARMTAVGIMLTVVVPIAVGTVKFVPDPSGAVPVAAASLEDTSAVGAQVEPSEEMGPGTWELRPARSTGVVSLSLSHGQGRHGDTVAVSDLAGLNVETLAAGGAIAFRRRHDAGTFEFEGLARNGVAAGTYTFLPNPAFPEQLAARGLARPTLAQQQVLARQDIGIAFLDQLTVAGNGSTLEQLIRAAERGVDPEFVRGLREAGYTSLSLDELMRLRDNGVDQDYIRGLADVGHKSLSLDDLVNLRRRGVDPDYIRGLADLGHKSLSLDDLIHLRSRGVDPDYIRGLADLGHKSLSLDDLVRLRSSGVDPDYIRGLVDLGHKPLSLDDLVNLRSRGVDPDYIRELAEVGYKSLSLDQLIELRNRGIDADYIKGMSGLTDRPLSLEQLIDLRQRGVGPDDIRELSLLAK